MGLAWVACLREVSPRAGGLTLRYGRVPAGFCAFTEGPVCRTVEGREKRCASLEMEIAAATGISTSFEHSKA
jgi:hypothetical protein